MADGLHLTPAMLHEVASFASRRRYRAGAMVFAVGDPAGAMFVLQHGALRIESGGGGEIVIDEAGSIIGELAALEGRPRTATAYAATDLTLLALSPANLPTLLDSVDGLAERVHESARQRDRSPAWTGDAAASLPADRLARWVIDRGGIDLSLGALAAELGVSRELVTRAIDHLVATGALSVERGEVSVRSLDALAAAAT